MCLISSFPTVRTVPPVFMIQKRIESAWKRRKEAKNTDIDREGPIFVEKNDRAGVPGEKTDRKNQADSTKTTELIRPSICRYLHFLTDYIQNHPGIR